MNPIHFGISNMLTREGLEPRARYVSYPLNLDCGRSAIDLPARKGDVIFGVAGNAIHEVSVVRETPENTGGNNADAVYVGVETLRLREPVFIPAATMAKFPPSWQGFGSHCPSCAAASEQELLYVQPLAPGWGKKLWALVEEQVVMPFVLLGDSVRIYDMLDQAALHEVLARRDLPEEIKVQMDDAFHGQGAFRAAVEARGVGCVFTDPAITLRRGHQIRFVKPWRLCTDEEKIDPENAIQVDLSLADAFEFGALTLHPEGFPLVSGDVSEDYFTGTSFRLTDDFDWPRLSPAQAKYFQYRNAHLFVDHSPLRRDSQMPPFASPFEFIAG